MNIKHDCYHLAPTFLLWLILLGLTLPGPVSADSHSGKSKMVDLWQPGDSGQRTRIRGRVTSIDGHPMPNVVIRFRHADSEGIDWSYHLGEAISNEKGVYQFGSVIPGNSHRLSHAAEDDPDAIFLEAGTVDGETMMYGRYDITLIPR